MAKGKLTAHYVSTEKERVESLIKDEQFYKFWIYTGKKPMSFNYRGTNYRLEPGDQFGVRESADKKKIRFILGEDVNRVFTIEHSALVTLSKNSKPARRV